MQRISDMYYIRKQLMIQEMVEHDEDMIKNGEVTIDEETGEVDIAHLTNQGPYNPNINDDNSNINKLQTQENENGKERSDDAMAIEMDEDSSQTSNTSISLAASATHIHDDNEIHSTTQSIDTPMVNKSDNIASKKVLANPQTAKETMEQPKTYSEIATNNQASTQNNTSSSKILRLRFQFKAEKPTGAKYHT